MIGINNILRMLMELYLYTNDLWFNLEESLEKLNYSLFLNTYILDMRLDSYDAYDEATTKKCNDIIKNYHDLFQGLLNTTEF